MEKVNTASDSSVGGKSNAEKWGAFREKMNHEESAKFFAKESCESEYIFAKRLKKLGTTQMSEKEFGKWEDDLSIWYYKAKKNAYEDYALFVRGGGRDEGDMISDLMSRTVAYPGGGREEDLKNTIEARAGYFYEKRRNMLRVAINNSDMPAEKKEKDLAAIRQFEEDVYRHMDWKNKTREQLRNIGFESADAARTRAHNDVIKDLNNLNDLAKEYGTRPFTMRNFLPSDAVSRRSQTRAQAEIMRYDRDIVEEYYALAFPNAAEKEEQKIRRDSMFGLSDYYN
jgi:hypothetical protein